LHLTTIFSGRYVMPVLAMIGVLGGIAYVVRGSTPPPVAQPVAPPTVAPYRSYIAGSGMLEASTRNVAISTPVGGVVTKVFVKVGDRVRKGEALFRIDGRDLEAQLTVRAAAAAAAHAQILEAQALSRSSTRPTQAGRGFGTRESDEPRGSRQPPIHRAA